MKPLDLPEIPLPNHWTTDIKRGLLAAFTLAHYTLVNVRAWGHSTEQRQVRREVEHERRETDAALLREQNRILKERLSRVESKPHYTRFQRFAILGVQMARGWSNSRTAREFLVAAQTIATWHRKLDNDTLLEAPGAPVNQFPDFVTTLVQQLKTLFPLLGCRQMAGWLARAGLQLSATSIRRMLKKPVQLPRRPHIPFPPKTKPAAGRTVVAKYPGHVWNCDITTVPTSWGLAISWWPTGFPALFPFCWKVVAVLDAHSRKVLAIKAFRKEPSAEEVVTTLDAAVAENGSSPRYLITDKGSQFFDSKNKKPAVELRGWLDRCAVKPRFGAVGKKGSIPVIERFFRTLKQEGILRMLVPFDSEWIHAELDVFVEWYNSRRPHSSLLNATPSEAHLGTPPPVEQPRYEVRARYPVASEDVASGQIWRTKRVTLDAGHFKRRKHLPDVSLDVAA